MKSQHGIIHKDEAGKLFDQEFGGKDSERDKTGRFKGKGKTKKKDDGK